MGFSEAESSKCRRHPCVRQSPGVCSSCLREKLSKLSASSASFNRLKPKTIIVSHSGSISPSPPYSSASSSTASHRRNGSAAYVSVGMVLNNNNNNNTTTGLKKSRSVSCANLSSRTKFRGSHDDIVNDKLKTCVNNEVADEEVRHSSSNNLKKKNGFIKKLMNTTTNKIKTRGVLMHSKTMNERSLSSSASAAVVTSIHNH